MTSVTSEEKNKELYSFIYGDEAVSYEVVRSQNSESKKRKIVIKVHPDCRVVVKTPVNAIQTDIHQSVMKRAKWIYDSITEFKGHLEYVQTKHYVSGEMQFYLGRRYLLKVIKDTNKVSNVKLTRGQLQVSLKVEKENRRQQVKLLVDKWYFRRAELIFKERLNALFPQTNWIKDLPKYRILAMQKQWGSCSAQGNLMLNPHLVKAPKECIDYVILHELCHIAEHNHSDRFWRLLSSVMPNWKEVKTKLDDMAELYLNE